MSANPSDKQVPAWFWPVVLALLILAATAGYYWGYQQALPELVSREEAHQVVKQLEADAAAEADEFQRQLTILAHGNEIERQAAEQLRQNNIELQNQVSELDRKLNFYRSIMAPQDGRKGLQIHELILQRAKASSERLHYRLVLTQLASKDRVVAGVIKVDVEGEEAGQKKRYSFTELAEDFPESGKSFKFVYFQDIEGVFSVPAGFRPQQVIVQVVPRGRKARSLSKTFNWQIKGE